MPLLKSAKKAVRKSLRRRVFNERRKRAMKDAIKKFKKAVKVDKAEAVKLLNSVYAMVDKAAKRGVIKKNNAARKKSRLARLALVH